jgi:diaminopimelate epimerase
MSGFFYGLNFIKSMKIQIINIRPGGNDTSLVKGIIRDPIKRKFINDKIMKLYPNIEQVGFVNLDPENPELLMAGGEFCANAIVCNAFLTLGGKPGKILIKASGVKRKLVAGVTANSEAFAEMPVNSEPKQTIIKIKNSSDYLVKMDGIIHYVTFSDMVLKNMNQNQIKQRAMNIIKQNKLDTFPAAGVMYVRKMNKELSIIPVVYVRDINTLFIESACGSGSTAVGMVVSLKNNSGIKDLSIYQPSGNPIKVTVNYKKGKFSYTQIQNPIKVLNDINISIDI